MIMINLMISISSWKAVFKENTKGSKPWITTELNNMMKIRNKIFQRRKQQPNTKNNKRL